LKETDEMQRRFPTCSPSVNGPDSAAPSLTPFNFAFPGHRTPPNTEMPMNATQMSETTAPPPAIRYFLV
jgi:hypothetical protein